MDPDEITGPDKEMRQRVAAAEKKAARTGHLQQHREEHATKSWMKGDETREPSLAEKTEREVHRIERKQEKGETLTRHEAGVLGGAARAEERD